MKTFIRRSGNKSRFLKKLLPLIPDFTGKYIEPFLGTGAIFLALLPEKAILNDLNTDIMEIWKLAKSDPEYMISEIEKFRKKFTPLSKEERLKYCKNVMNNLGTYTPNKRVVMYLCMIYTSFNPMDLQNGRFGSLRDHDRTLFSELYKTKLREVSKVLQNGVKLENKDYTKILKSAKPGDFVFLDPPYIEDKKYNFEYIKNSKFDITKLKHCLDMLTKKKVLWMMTQADTPQVRALFKGYSFFEYINKSGFGNGVRYLKEIVVMNYQ